MKTSNVSCSTLQVEAVLNDKKINHNNERGFEAGYHARVARIRERTSEFVVLPSEEDMRYPHLRQCTLSTCL